MATSYNEKGEKAEEEEEEEEEDDDEHKRKVKAFWDYGWIKVGKITNSTKMNVIYKVPDTVCDGTIPPNSSESEKCVGWLPYESYSERYTIKYYNHVADELQVISLSDPGSGWKLKIVQPGISEDERVVRYLNEDRRATTIRVEVFNTYDGFSMFYSGYKIHNYDTNMEIGEFSTSKRSW